MSKRVLVVKTSSLGDIIHALPALTDAANAIPGIVFDWISEETFAEIPHWHPNVDRVIEVAIRRWRKSPVQTARSGEWAAYKTELQKHHYDAVIDCQGLLKSAWVSREAHGPKFGMDRQTVRESFASFFYDFTFNVPKEQHAVERIRQLFAKSLGYALPKTYGDFGLDCSNFPKGIVDKPSYAVFLHGTTWETKHWPENYWIELAQKTTASGMPVVLLWGNDKEKARAERIAAVVENVTVLPKLTIKEAGGVLCEAKAVVSVDTGLGHLAAALNVPSVCLYGPTSPLKVGTYGPDQKHLTLDDCPAGDFPSTSLALFAPMTPEVVWQVFEPLLS